MEEMQTSEHAISKNMQLFTTRWPNFEYQNTQFVNSVN